MKLAELMKFNTALPEPYNTIDVSPVRTKSKYVDNPAGINISNTCFRAFHIYAKSMRAKTDEQVMGSLGTDDQKRHVAEIRHDDGSTYDCIVYTPGAGLFYASTIDRDTGTTKRYVFKKDERSGMALIFCLIPILLEDPDCFDIYTKLVDDLVDFNNIVDKELFRENMALLSDNVYRRLHKKDLTHYINVEITNDNSVGQINSGAIKTGSYAASQVTCGKFDILCPVDHYKSSTNINMTPEEFNGRFKFSKRELNQDEYLLCPKVDETFVLTEEVLDICYQISESRKYRNQFSNVLLFGESGGGKTESAVAIAAGLGLPYVTYVCNPGTEIIDLIGQFVPRTEAENTKRSISRTKRKQNYYSWLKEHNLPDVDDIKYDLEDSYEKLTGNTIPINYDKDEVTEDLINTLMVRIYEKCLNFDSNSSQFVYVPSLIMEALEKGWLVEIQEPSVIAQPGMLTALNSLLTYKGKVMVQTGKIIQRHEDCIVVMTTNLSYEGCVEMNQSVISRIPIVKEILMPNADAMADRAMAMTGCTDRDMVVEMVDYINKIRTYLSEQHIRDGVCGMRELANWITSTMIIGSKYETVVDTVINKATFIADEKDTIITAVFGENLKGGNS